MEFDTEEYHVYVFSLGWLPGQVRTGQARTGQVRVGQVRTGQIKTCEVKLEQVQSSKDTASHFFWTQHFLNP